MKKQKENLKPPYQRLAPSDAQLVWASVSIAALFSSLLGALLLLSFVSLLMGLALDSPFQVAFFGILVFLLFAASLCLASWVSSGSWRLPLGASINRASIRQALLFGIALFGLSIALIYAIYIPLSFIIPDLIVCLFQDSEPFIWLISEKTYIAASLANAILMIIVAPFVEEFFFRGYLLHRLIVKVGVKWAIWISSIIFGVLHADIFGATIFGVVLCYLTLYSKSLRGPLLAHGCHNLLVVMSTLVVGLYEGYEGELVGSMSLEEFYETWWIGIAGGLIALPWVFWVWHNRQSIKPAEWAAPLIEHSRLQPAGPVQYSPFGRSGADKTGKSEVGSD